MKTRKYSFPVGLALSAVFLAFATFFAAPLAAEIAEPHFVLYGRATTSGVQLPAGARIRLEVDGEALAAYVMASNPDLHELYALRVPLDTVGIRLPGHARTGDTAKVYFGGEGANPGQLAALLVIGEPGGTLALDLDPATLASGIVAGDVSVVEGDAGSTTVQVPITLTQASPTNVEVDFITRNGSASSSSDYTPRLGRATIPAGQTQTTVSIQVAGDTQIEPDEDFFVDLSAPLGGVLLDPEGRVTLLDDDTPPAISVADLSVNEPNPGTTRQVTFQLRLSHVWDSAVSVAFSAFDPPGQATNGSDYILNPATINIPAGQVTRQVTVTILGDLLNEIDETFELRLSNPVGATLGDSVGVATITDYVRILRFLEQHEDQATASALSGTAPGLGGAFDLALSPDGQNLYVAGRASDSLAVFTRATDGTLSHLATYQNGVGGVTGLNGIEALRVSADGTRVFAASFDDNAVASFSRAPDGTLVFVDADFDGVLDAQSGRTVNGLAGATALIEVPGLLPSDPDHLYVCGLLDNAVAVFTIAADGRLEYETAARDGVFGADGLAQPAAIAFGGSGRDVYVAGYSDDSVALFTRNPEDGFLTFRQILVDNSGGIFGLNGALDVAVSPDEDFVYTAGQNSHAIAVFARNPANGFLTYTGSVVDGIGGVDGLRQVTGLAFSHDPAFGDYLFATSYGENAVAIFERQENGSLVYVEQVRDGVGGADGIAGANALVASADDQNVYVAGSGESKVAVFERDIVAPEVILAIFSTSHQLSTPSPLGTLAFQWAGGSDVGYGVAEYWLLLDDEAGTVAPPAAPSLRVQHGADPHTAQLASPGDGDNIYLHLTTCDLIGNCSPNHLGPFVVDTTDPALPQSLASSSHGSPSSEPRITTTWLTASDIPAASGYASGLGGYLYEFRATATPDCGGGQNLTASATTVRSGVLAVGTWFFHLCAVDAVGNIGPAAVLGPLEILPDTTPPQVLLIDSVARSTDGRIGNGELLDGSITQLVVQLSESVQETDAETTANYRIYQPGSNGTFESTDCTGPAGDDVLVTLGSATYDDVSRRAALQLPANQALAKGQQRALVCPAIRDLRGNALGGGSAYQIDFGAPGRGLQNPNFDNDLASWTFSQPATAWNAVDADLASTSGSATFVVTTQAESASQCVSGTALTELEGMAGLRARVRVADQGADSVEVVARLVFYAGAACAGTELGTADSAILNGDSGGAFQPIGIEASIPSGTVSVLAAIVATPTGIDTSSEITLDRTLLAQSLLFTDGFESGDTSAWDLTSP